MTAIASAESDNRIKAIFAFDAWVWFIVDEVEKGSYKLNIP